MGSKKVAEKRRMDGGGGEEEETGDQRSRYKFEEENPKGKRSKGQQSAASSSPQMEEAKFSGSNKPPENQSQLGKHQSRTEFCSIGSKRSQPFDVFGEEEVHYLKRISIDKYEKKEPKRERSKNQPSASSSKPQMEENQNQEREHQSRIQETQVSSGRSNVSRGTHSEKRSVDTLEMDNPKRRDPRVEPSAPALSSRQIEETESPGFNNSRTQETQVPAAGSKPRVNDPRRQFAGLIEDCKGPFEHKLTNADLKEQWLSITKQNYKKYFEPFFGDNGGDGAKMTLYNGEDEMEKSREYAMNLKLYRSKYLICGEWDRFREEQKSLIKVNGILKIWAFRHLENRGIYCAMASGTGSSLDRFDPTRTKYQYKKK